MALPQPKQLGEDHTQIAKELDAMEVHGTEPEQRGEFRPAPDNHDAVTAPGPLVFL